MFLFFLFSLYNGQSVKDDLLIVGEFQPCSDEYNPIHGEAIMESVIFQNSIDSVSSMKKYHIGQVTLSADEPIEESNLLVMKHQRIVQFLSKPWQCAWNENKGRDKSDIRYCFVVSVLQPYSIGAEGRYCLKLIGQFQSTLFEICCSQRRAKVEFQNSVTEYQMISDNDMNSESGKWSTTTVDTIMSHISNGPPSSSLSSHEGLRKEKDLKFCHSFCDDGNIATPMDDSMTIDENIFDNLELLRNVSFRIMRSDSKYGQMLSDRSHLPVVKENDKTLISLILSGEVVDLMDVSYEDDDD